MATGITTPKAKQALNPYNDIKPGLMINVAALVKEAANDRLTESEENDLFPIAQASMLFSFALDLNAKQNKTVIKRIKNVKVVML